MRAGNFDNLDPALNPTMPIIGNLHLPTPLCSSEMQDRAIVGFGDPVSVYTIAVAVYGDLPFRIFSCELWRHDCQSLRDFHQFLNCLKLNPLRRAVMF